MFVTVDGPNGVGKTSVTKEVVSCLQSRGNAVVATREPSDSELGRFIRANEFELHGIALAVLVVADRHVHVRTEIEPALREGAIVVSDRYVASTLVLQRIDGLELQMLWELNADVSVPDLSVILTARPETIRSRLAARGRVSRFDRMEDIATVETAYFDDAARFLASVGYHTLVVDTDGWSVADVAHEVQVALGDVDSGGL